MLSDHTKSRRIHASLGNGLGNPTGFEFSRVIPSVPSFLIEETAWQLIQEDCSRGIPTFSPSMIEFPNRVGCLFFWYLSWTPSKLKGRVAELWVIDKHPQALKADEQLLWRPAHQAQEVLAQASVGIMIFLLARALR